MEIDETIKDLLEKQQEQDMELLHGLDRGDFEDQETGRYVLRRLNAIRKLLGKKQIRIEKMRRMRQGEPE